MRIQTYWVMAAVAVISALGPLAADAATDPVQEDAGSTAQQAKAGVRGRAGGTSASATASAVAQPTRRPGSAIIVDRQGRVTRLHFDPPTGGWDTKRVIERMEEFDRERASWRREQDRLQLERLREEVSKSREEKARSDRQVTEAYGAEARAWWYGGGTAGRHNDRGRRPDRSSRPALPPAVEPVFLPRPSITSPPRSGGAAGPWSPLPRNRDGR